VSLVPASKQTIGRPTTCPKGRSPYVSHPAAAGSTTQQPAASGAVTAAQHGDALTVALLGVLIVLLSCALLALRRLRRRLSR
jgi:hypothetical protein